MMTTSRARILGAAWAWMLRLQQATWRTEIEGLERLDNRLARGERTLVAFWHGQYIPLFTLLGGRRACVFTSQSFRGDVIVEICRRFDYDCIQIPNHARDRSLELMRQALAAHRAGGIAVDGPLGPDHVVKRGVIQLASELDFALLPVAVASCRHRVLWQRWDHMEIPRLFTRVALVVGEVLTVPPGVTTNAVEPWACRLHDALAAAEQRAQEKIKI